MHCFAGILFSHGSHGAAQSLGKNDEELTTPVLRPVKPRTKIMFRTKALALLAAASLAGCVTENVETQVVNPAPYVEPAYTEAGVSFDDFQRELEPYGRWMYHPRWGDVWRPERVGFGFRPYNNGYWTDTREYGWMWVSNDPWGDVTYRYGR